MNLKVNNFSIILQAENKVNVYCGEQCNEKENYWNVYAEGDMQDDDTTAPLILDCNFIPRGSKVIVKAPICPNCDAIEELCECDFDWDNWIDCQYS